PLRNGLALLKARPDGETTRRVHAVMERQVAQMARLVDDLLDVSRIDRGKLDLRMEPVSADAIAGAAMETAMPNITARGHVLDVSIPSDPLFIEGDRVRLAQAVANVLNNAAKFTPANGRIALSLTREDADAVIRVQDNGVGIEPGDIDSIFD